MKRIYFAILLSTILSAGAAYADDRSYNSNVRSEMSSDGTSKRDVSEEKVNSDGTLIKSRLEDENEVDDDGTHKTTSTVTTTTDPKGLGNKTWSQRKVKTTEGADGSYDRKADSVSVDASGTTHSKSIERDVKVNSDGSGKTTYKEKVVRDPKGFMNRSVEESEKTIKKDAHGNVISNEESKTINGHTER
jgi:hypothetical protein